MNNKEVTVIGAGLAGCECAWQLAKRGISVNLVEMKPNKKSPAHKSDLFAELVCSNSLRSSDVTNAVGLLKEELRRLGSLIIESADKNSVPAGSALAVDREGFSKYITDKIRASENIRISSEEAVNIPEGPVIIATGPLTSDAFAEEISRQIPGFDLYFFDAVAPIVTLESIDMQNAYFASRYDKGTPDYVNCPLSKEEYESFINELCKAKEAEIHGFDNSAVFEGCMPVEVMAKRGFDTLRFGPMKPVGLLNPHSGKNDYAVLQLRRDNADGTLYNLVGFQTHLTFGEQKRIFSMIPALKNAEFVRYGVMHRNTFLDSPRLLDSKYRLKSNPDISFAGQITGVEGYVESAASGMLVGIETAAKILDKEPADFPRETAIGALAAYISNSSIVDFQPMNINFGIISPLTYKVKGKANKKAEVSNRALKIIDEIQKKEVFSIENNN
ncbi:MAG: methylenetetrahydrofolate--tRNA-(uracil(54)-C(5))-methyltransferase (FADH(2)-oxidizing) TrmFO [Ruminococcaceae bacterium]|nr:methylenetetrahydrofolate--tRNA-(uracil(54)-C(5))-methyltransferase (FADH(2)-oxidizing) TrmFO [Oscillospiraceae bacterium]